MERLVSLVDETGFLGSKRADNSGRPEKVGFSGAGFLRVEIVAGFLSFSDEFYERVF